MSENKFVKLTKKAIAYEQEPQNRLEKSKVRINAQGGGRKPILSFLRSYLFSQTKIKGILAIADRRVGRVYVLNVLEMSLFSFKLNNHV